MSEFSRFKHLGWVPSPQDVAKKIRECRTVLSANVNGAPLCSGESLRTAEDFAGRYASCMECYRATSNARGLVGHSEDRLKEAFVHIDRVLDACTLILGAHSDPIPPPTKG